MASYLMVVGVNIDCHCIGSSAVCAAIINLETEARIGRAACICRRREPEAPAI